MLKPWPEVLFRKEKPQNSAFHAQSSRLIIVVVQLGAVKIYVAAVEALRKKERQDGWRRWNPAKLYRQNWWFSEFHPPLNANVRFCRFKKIIWPVLWPNSGFWCCVFLTTLWITLLSSENFPWLKGWALHFLKFPTSFFFSFSPVKVGYF
jgi:nicotinamidase-related amidase